MWKVLVVDDDFVNRKLLTAILNGRAKCDVAANGQEALEAYRYSLKQNTPYDIILLDIAMPDVNGIEVLKTIRKMEEENGVKFGEGIPIIMVTAYKEPFLQAFNKGCDDYILKPIDGEQLIVKIEEKLAG